MNDSNDGNWLFKFNLYLNNTEITTVDLFDMDYTWQLDGTYTFTTFDTASSAISNENWADTSGQGTGSSLNT